MLHEPTEASPTPSRERLAVLDLIRGCALLGIFVMNVPYIGGSFWAGYQDQAQWPEWWDRGAVFARDLVFAGKFNAMFSLLFALGFSIQLERLIEQDPTRAVSIYLRRLAWLFVFGMAHATLLWSGDVLHVYAVLGLILLALRRAPDRVLMWLAVFALCYSMITGGIKLALSTPADVESALATGRQWLASDNAVFGHGDYVQAVQHNFATMLHYYSEPARADFYALLITTMLLGLVIGRRRFLHDLVANLPLVKRAQWWALAVGVVSSVPWAIRQLMAHAAGPSIPQLLTAFSFRVSRIALLVFYVCTIARAAASEPWRRRLTPLMLAGRMPLTNYLMQTLIGTFLFYHWGLGFWNRIGPALEVLAAIGIFLVIQLPLSMWWLARFQLGPMEYLWRVLTYGPGAMRDAVTARASLAMTNSAKAPSESL